MNSLHLRLKIADLKGAQANAQPAPSWQGFFLAIRPSWCITVATQVVQLDVNRVIHLKI
jgi:hypothetical protein